jgi:hypothetical protein
MLYSHGEVQPADVAFQVLTHARTGDSTLPSTVLSREAHLRDLKTQFVSALLFVLTVAAVCCATINFRQQSLYRLADDGVIWVDRVDSSGRNSAVALHVPPGGEAENAGIRDGDVLVQIA